DPRAGGSRVHGVVPLPGVAETALRLGCTRRGLGGWARRRSDGVTETVEQAQQEASAVQATIDVRLQSVTKRFDNVVAVDDLSLSVEQGSFFAMLGPSGCGKTTTLRMIGGFEEPTRGTIYLGDREVTGQPPYKRDVNTVFQSYALFPHLTIFENVAFGLRRKGTARTHLKPRVE